LTVFVLPALYALMFRVRDEGEASEPDAGRAMREGP